MSDLVRVTGPDFGATLAQAAADPQLVPEVERVLGDAWIGFTDELAGSGRAPGSNWPIGTRKGSGRAERYVPPGTPGARESGRSLQGWRPEIRGFDLVAINDSRDGRGRSYAQHVHLRGESPGAALRRADAAFGRMTDEVGEAIADLLQELV